MSIFFVTGKPGGGKSFYAVKQILDEVMKSDRFIVTNIALNLGEIRDYIHRHREEEPPDLKERIRIISDSQMAEFWLYEPGRDFEKRKDVELRGKSISVPDFEDRAKRGCLYVIDECHIGFGARDWQATGTDCTFFLSQHRKLRCDVIFVTQHPDQVDKALRRLAEDYVTMRNLGREPFMGFHIASAFRWQRSLNPPSSANPRVFESGFLRLDTKEVGKMYDTMSGVGIQGRVQPVVQKKGRSKFWLIVPGILLFLLFFVAPRYVVKWAGQLTGHFVGKTVGAFSGTATNDVPASTNTIKVPPVPAPTPQPSITNVSGTTPQIEAAKPPPVRLKGYVHLPSGEWLFTLDDGRVLSSKDSKFQLASSDILLYGGQVYEFDKKIPLASNGVSVASGSVSSPAAANNSSEYADIPSRIRLKVAPIVVWDAERGQPR